MNREIKFRAWIIGRDRDIYGTLNGDNCMIETTDLERKREFPLMQYTGLKDKNGKEVYCSDIVLFPDTESEFVDVGVGSVKVAEQGVNAWGVVKMQDYSWGLDIQMNNEVIGKGFYSFNEIGQNLGLEDFEVIGNIYENPELLNN